MQLLGKHKKILLIIFIILTSLIIYIVYYKIKQHNIKDQYTSYNQYLSQQYDFTIQSSEDIRCKQGDYTYNPKSSFVINCKNTNGDIFIIKRNKEYSKIEFQTEFIEKYLKENKDSRGSYKYVCKKTTDNIIQDIDNLIHCDIEYNNKYVKISYYYFNNKLEYSNVIVNVNFNNDINNRFIDIIKSITIKG